MLKLLLLTFFCAVQATTPVLLPNSRDETKKIEPVKNITLSEDAKSYILHTEILAGVVAGTIVGVGVNILLRSSCNPDSTGNEYLIHLLQSGGGAVLQVGAACLGMQLGAWYAKRNLSEKCKKRK